MQSKISGWSDNAGEEQNNFALTTKNKLLSSMDALINDNQNYTPEQKNKYQTKFKEALELALDIHKDQKPRPQGPYINHILSVANRLVEEFAINDPELIIAALLHDSVEDQSEKLAQLISTNEPMSNREKALLYIKNTFGARVESAITKLSNPEHKPAGLSAEEKNNIYKDHVREAIKDPDVLLIKLADFLDNAGDLGSVYDLALRLKWSKKYLPVMSLFIEKIDQAQGILETSKIIELKNRLLLMTEEAKDFINQQEGSS